MGIKFSILVPVYQVEKYIDECIQSVLAQTYSNWELILVDDGTKDRSGEICDCYAEKDSRIHVYHKENGGLMHTRRYGIARATGDYYIFLDSDDTIKPHALQTIYDTIQKHDTDCVVYGYERVQNGKMIERSAKEKEITIVDKRELYQKVFLSQQIWSYVMMCRKATKASVFGGVDYEPYYHIRLGEDDLQSLEIWKESDKVTFIDDRLYRYRMNPASITANADNLVDLENGMTVRQMVYEFLCEQGYFDKEDLTEYETACYQDVCYYIFSIAACKESFSEKINFLKRMKRENLYCSFLEKRQYTKIIMNMKTKVISGLFVKGWHRSLIVLSMIYKSYLGIKKRLK